MLAVNLADQSRKITKQFDLIYNFHIISKHTTMKWTIWTTSNSYSHQL